MLRIAVRYGMIAAVAVFLCQIPFMGIAQENSSPAPDPEPLKGLAWMAGHWTGKDQGVETEEVWLAPKGELMVGMHRDHFPSGRAFFEFLRIQSTDKGIIYFASPMGAKPTRFLLSEMEAGCATFENPDHDFPQRIIYRLKKDRLHARIEGKQEGKVRSEEWIWQRKGK